MSSVKVFWPDKEVLESALQEYVAFIAEKTEVISIYLCGSRAKGNYTVASDIDLLIIVKNDDRSYQQRFTSYYPDRFPVSMDLFIYTQKEADNNSFAQNLIKDGVCIWCRYGE